MKNITYPNFNDDNDNEQGTEFANDLPNKAQKALPRSSLKELHANEEQPASILRSRNNINSNSLNQYSQGPNTDESYNNPIKRARQQMPTRASNKDITQRVSRQSSVKFEPSKNISKKKR